MSTIYFTRNSRLTSPNSKLILVLLLGWHHLILQAIQSQPLSSRLQVNNFDYPNSFSQPDYSSYYPSEPDGPGYQVPAQIPIFQNSGGTKGGPKTNIDNGQWWNWKNVVGTKQVSSRPINVAPPVFYGQKMHSNPDDRFDYGYQNNYNQASAFDFYGQTSPRPVGKISQPATISIAHRPRPASNWFAPAPLSTINQQPLLNSEASNNVRGVGPLSGKIVVASQVYDTKGQPPVAMGGDWYRNGQNSGRPRFLGFGSVQQVGQGRGQMRLICRFDEPLMMDYDSSLSNVKWSRFFGNYNPARLEPSFDCLEPDCQVTDIQFGVDNPRFRMDRDLDGYTYILTVDDVRPEDYGNYRCSASKTNLNGRYETVYQIIPFKS